ncbi:hypothetical protein THC_1217 [Caldimicrobium thiodismutans]|uniref:Thiamine-binding protein domain-containing protein n=1 Tax=Caldimicrobium thiodismutans TaxID=1653476 RepID=A0A0U5ANE4_9BACT|nr:MTH1187 family thiamine-binding protein [Caldimicrobium thiodismutans]BAU23588.1 hypothetical protein THC_1217 [Caldimicrobium thiodismutans]
MSVLVSISIFPLDKGESVSSYVARAVKVIKESGFPYKVSPMETTFETETLDSALSVIRKCFEVMESDCNRVICNVKFDYRKGRSSGIISKLKSLEEKLGEEIERS